jgi:hypothetical protein
MVLQVCLLFFQLRLWDASVSRSQRQENTRRSC